jgi:hypothetical protein
MSEIKLTKKQKEIYQLLLQTKGGFLRRHVKMSGTMCWRLIDSRYAPVSNIGDRYVDALKGHDLFDEGAERGSLVLKENLPVSIRGLGIHVGSFSKAS